MMMMIMMMLQSDGPLLLFRCLSYARTLQILLTVSKPGLIWQFLLGHIAAVQKQTSLSDLYAEQHVSLERSAFWGVIDNAAHLGVTSQKSLLQGPG